jgi:hypothetical protein
MKWDPKNMLLHDVYSPYGSLQAAGLESIGRRSGTLILRFLNGTVREIQPGEEIPLPALPRTIQESVTILKTKRNVPTVIRVSGREYILRSPDQFNMQPKPRRGERNVQ